MYGKVAFSKDKIGAQAHLDNFTAGHNDNPGLGFVRASRSTSRTAFHMSTWSLIKTYPPSQDLIICFLFLSSFLLQVFTLQLHCFSIIVCLLRLSRLRAPQSLHYPWLDRFSRDLVMVRKVLYFHWCRQLWLAEHSHIRLPWILASQLHGAPPGCLRQGIRQQSLWFY